MIRPGSLLVVSLYKKLFSFHRAQVCIIINMHEQEDRTKTIADVAACSEFSRLGVFISFSELLST